MTVLEYMKFVADLKKIPKEKRESMITEIMDMVKITDMKNRLIKNLSKGYRQRVGLAQAMMGYPDVIILDEPTVGLDPKQIIEIRSLIRSLKEKHTVILSSHILSEVSAVCDYVLILSHGKLVASDTPQNLAKLAEGSNTLILQVKGTQPVIEEIIGNTDCVRSVQMKETEQSGIFEIQISTEAQADIREQLFYAFAGQHCPILEMQQKKVSLEEIFLELTEGEADESNL